MNLAALPEEDQNAFAGLDLGVATLSPQALGPVLLEPHASWMVKIAEDWQARYGLSK